MRIYVACMQWRGDEGASNNWTPHSMFRHEHTHTHTHTHTAHSTQPECECGNLTCVFVPIDAPMMGRKEGIFFSCSMHGSRCRLGVTVLTTIMLLRGSFTAGDTTEGDATAEAGVLAPPPPPPPGDTTFFPPPAQECGECGNVRNGVRIHMKGNH